MFERFTDRARRVVVLAQEVARELNHVHIGTEHLLVALIREGNGVAAKALEAVGVTELAVLAFVKDGPPGVSPPGHMSFTPRVKKVIELSLREALQLGHNYIGTEHLLLAILREGNGVAIDALTMAGVDPTRVRQQVIQLLSGKVEDDPAPNCEDAEDLATLVISGVLAGEHVKARRVVDALTQLGWRPPSFPA